MRLFLLGGFIATTAIGLMIKAYVLIFKAVVVHFSTTALAIVLASLLTVYGPEFDLGSREPYRTFLMLPVGGVLAWVTFRLVRSLRRHAEQRWTGARLWAARAGHLGVASASAVLIAVAWVLTVGRDPANAGEYGPLATFGLPVLAALLAASHESWRYSRWADEQPQPERGPVRGPRSVSAAWSQHEDADLPAAAGRTGPVAVPGVSARSSDPSPTEEDDPIIDLFTLGRNDGDGGREDAAVRPYA